MVVKVQLPIISSETEVIVFIYNKSREIELMLPLTPKLDKQIGGRLRTFWHAKITDDAEIIRLEKEASPEERF
jgi:hypothetical protein